MNAIPLFITGASGRMGRALLQAVALQPAVCLAAAVARPGSPVLGQDSGSLIGAPASGIALVDTLDAAFAANPTIKPVVIDFTRPEATAAAVTLCQRQGVGMVIGTTGLDPQQQAQLVAAAREIPICFAANFSVGVTVSLRLLELATEALGPAYDVEIVEAHHRHKVDAPSGTALAMGRAVAHAAGTTLEEAAIYARQGHTGPRPAGRIGFSTVRGGDVVGEHTVMFLGEGERLEIRHSATSRLNFAQGAVRAAQWIATQAPGLYDMRDVLGLRRENQVGSVAVVGGIGSQQS